MEKVKLCPKCKEEFIVKWFEYPTNLDDKRESYIICPYCHAEIERVLVGKREDFIEYKKEESNLRRKK